MTGTGRATRQLINVGSVERDVATQPRLEIRMDVVEEYAASLRAGADLPPVVVFEDDENRLWLADGWHRLMAHEAAELEEMWAEIYTGQTRRDALLYAVGANHAHGLRRTNADKRRAVETLLRDPEWSAWSDRAIAEACRVTHPFVAQVREQVVTVTTREQANAEDRRTGRDGKSYPAADVRRELRISAPDGSRIGRDGKSYPVAHTEHEAVGQAAGDDAGGAAPYEPAGVMGGPEEPVAPPSSAVQDDVRGDRGVAQATEGPSAALPSSGSVEVAPQGAVRAAVCAEGQGSTPGVGPGGLRDGGASSEQQPEDHPARSSAAPGVATGAGVETSGPPSGSLGLEDEDAEVVVPAEDEDEEVVRRPGSTSQVVTTSWRNSAPAVEGAPLIDLRCCSNLGIVWPESDLDVADPPWSYVQRIGATRASNHYACLPIREIVHQLARLRGARVAVWCTWPTVAAFLDHDTGARAVTGGVWVKSGALERDADAWDQLEVAKGDDFDVGHYGPGFHWSGCSEPVVLATRRPGYTDRAVALRNAWVERPGEHSEKPVGWMVDWIRRWVPPGGLVCDPYAGLGSVARAVLLAGGGRRYLGTEIDPERHARALFALAEVQDG